MAIKVKVRKPLVLLFIAIFVFSIISGVHALGVTATIPVGRAPTALAYDSAKGEVFVTNGQDNTTMVISDSTNSVVATIPVETYPYGIAYDSGKDEIFAVNLNSNTVSVISDITNTVVATIPVGQSPYGITYDSGKDEIFVANSYDGSVSVISDNTNAVVATVLVGIEPFAVAYDSGKGEVFVTNANSNSVSVILDTTNGVVATISVANMPHGIIYDSSKGEVFVANANAGSISVISDSTNAVVATIGELGDQNVEDVAYDSGRGEIFASLHGTNKVAVISDSTNAVFEYIDAGNLPWGVTYDSGKSAIYVTNGGGDDVSVISGPSSTTSTGSGSGSFDWTWIIIIIAIIIVSILLILVWYSRQRKFVVTVQNSQTLSPISGANVSASGPKDLSGTTEANGQITFNDAEKGDYSIKASAIGYVSSTPVSVSVEKKMEYTIKLDPTPGGGSKVGEKRGFGDEGKALLDNKAPANQIQESPVQSAPPTPQTTSSPATQEESSEPQNWKDEKIDQTIQIFKEKGAISPETALTADELGLSRIFVRLIKRRREKLKIFVEINGKYYLDQQALKEKKQE
jgi:YVTN family beta-propeller protein